MAQQGEYGPKMKALPNDRWRRMVELLLEQGDRNATQAAEDAGFIGSRETLRVTAYKVSHDERFQAALHEEAQKRMKGLLPLAMRVHHEIMENPQASPAERLKGVQMVYDRAGMHAVSEHHVVSENIGADADVLKRIEALARGLGLPVEQVLGNRIKRLEAPTIDGEFEEVLAGSDEGIGDLI